MKGRNIFPPPTFTLPLLPLPFLLPASPPSSQDYPGKPNPDPMLPDLDPAKLDPDPVAAGAGSGKIRIWIRFGRI